GFPRCPARCPSPGRGGRTESVLQQQLPEVPAVEDLDVHCGVEFAQAPHLAVLPRDETLLQRSEFNEQVILGKIKIGVETLDPPPPLVPLQGERSGLVLPTDPVEIEDLCE